VNTPRYLQASARFLSAGALLASLVMVSACGNQTVDLGESPAPTQEASQAASADAATSTVTETADASPATAPTLAADPCHEQNDAATAWIKLTIPALAYKRVAKTAQKGIKQIEDLDYRGAYRTLSTNLPNAINALPAPMPEQSKDLLAQCSDADAKRLYLDTTTDHAQDFLDAFAHEFANGSGMGHGSVNMWLRDYEVFGPRPVMAAESNLMLVTFENGRGLKEIADTATTLSQAFKPQP